MSFRCSTRTLRLVAAISLLTLAAISVNAGPYQTTSPLDREARRELASSLAVGFGRLSREVPTLSPSDRAWIEREAKEALDDQGRITRRYLELTGSREWALRQIEVPLRTSLAALRSIESNHDNLKAEIVDWLVVASVLADFSFWQSINTLIQKKSIDERAVNGLFGDYVDQHLLFANATLKAKHILDEFVVPTLNAQL